MSEVNFPTVDESKFPLMIKVRQAFASAPPLDIPQIVQAGIEKLSIKAGARIGITAGSRGIVNMLPTLQAAVKAVKKCGATPLIIPAMGSHGGASAAGQTGVLASYGITEQSVGAPIEAAMDTTLVGQTPSGVDVHCSTVALGCDGVIVCNRIKPHTDFGGPLGSGILKMIGIGLGKQNGAGTMHRAAARMGLGTVMPDVARVLLDTAPIIAGIGLVENALHQSVVIEVIAAADLFVREEALSAHARAIMGRLPCEEIDLLIVDQIGKDISGTGMDPNVIGRMIHGHNSSLGHQPAYKPLIWRIFVRDLSEGSHGNASGIGMSDFTTERVAKAFDKESSYANALTSLSIQSVSMPVAFANDRIGIGAALSTLGLPDPGQARIMHISDTLNLQTIALSQSCLDACHSPGTLQTIGPAAPMAFDAEGNLKAVKGCEPILLKK